MKRITGVLFTVLATTIAVSTMTTAVNIENKQIMNKEVKNEGVNGENLKNFSVSSHYSTFVYEDAAGHDHVYSSGLNDHGQLGNGNLNNRGDIIQDDLHSSTTYQETKLWKDDEHRYVDGHVTSLQTSAYSAFATVEDQTPSPNNDDGGNQHIWTWGVNQLPEGVPYRYHDKDGKWVYRESKGQNENELLAVPVEIDTNRNDEYGADQLKGTNISTSGASATWLRYENEDFDRIFLWNGVTNKQIPKEVEEKGFILPPKDEKGNPIDWNILDVSVTDHFVNILANDGISNRLFVVGDNTTGALGNVTTTGVPLKNNIGYKDDQTDDKYFDKEANAYILTQEISIDSFNKNGDNETFESVTGTDYTSVIITSGDKTDHLYTMGQDASDEKLTGLLGDGNTGAAKVKGKIHQVNFYANRGKPEATGDIYDNLNITYSSGSEENSIIIANDRNTGLDHVFSWGNNRSDQLLIGEPSIGKNEYSAYPVDLDTNYDGVWGTTKTLMNPSLGTAGSITYGDGVREQVYTWGEVKGVIKDEYDNIIDIYSPLGLGEYVINSNSEILVKSTNTIVVDNTGVTVYDPTGHSVSSVGFDKDGNVIPDYQVPLVVDEDEQNGLQWWAIALIVLASLTVIGLIVGSIVYFTVFKK